MKVTHQFLIALPFALLLAIVPGADASTIYFTTTIDVEQEVPVPDIPSGFDPSGFGTLSLDRDSLLLSWDITYQGLTGPIVAPGAHLHGPAEPGETAGVRVFLAGGSSNAPLPQPASGRLVGSTTITEDYAGELIAGLWYVNIHTERNPAGEIRGQVTAIPEPSTIGLMAFGGLALGVGLVTRRRRGRNRA